ncbi:MAG: GAF domain-containing sensor histidine kinase [Actinomycetes bacterium]
MHELLDQLVQATRSLPTSLDEVGIARQLLTELKPLAPFDRGVLFSRDLSDHLAIVAMLGTDRVTWSPNLDDTRWDRALSSGEITNGPGSFSEPRSGFSVVLPLRLADHVIGLVGLERMEGDWTAAELVAAQQRTDEFAIRFDASTLFSQLRATATTEERKRLAREIHDGVAQQVTSVAYLMDTVTDELPASSQELLAPVREGLSEIIEELRFSIWELRSDVQPDRGLGATLSAYLRDVGAANGLKVHTVLNEASHRLSPTVETAVLRITQEAVTNVLKHANAQNLWVDCTLEPDRVLLRVADDGQGRVAQMRWDSFGMQIMRERAVGIGALLEIRDRVGGGTIVELSLTPEGKR